MICRVNASVGFPQFVAVSDPTPTLILEDYIREKTEVEVFKKTFVIRHHPPSPPHTGPGCISAWKVKEIQSL